MAYEDLDVQKRLLNLITPSFLWELYTFLKMNIICLCFQTDSVQEIHFLDH